MNESTDRRPVYVPRGRDPKGLLLGCTHSESNRKVGKMDAILADPHHDTRKKIGILMGVIVPS